MQNKMFNKSEGYVQKNNPFPVTSCGRKEILVHHLQKVMSQEKQLKVKDVILEL